MPTGLILVIAPDADFRRSLAFALETEGYAVSARGTIPAPEIAAPFHCVVLDARAATGPDETARRFCRGAAQVVLLTDDAAPQLGDVVTTIVPTPLAGDALSRAVAGCVAGHPMLRGAV